MSIAQKAILNQLGDKAIVTVWEPVSKDRYGKIIYGAPFLIKAEVKAKNGITRGANGQEISYSLSFYTEKDSVTERVKKEWRIAQGDKAHIADPIQAGAFSVLTVEEMTPILPYEQSDIIVRC